MAQRTTPEDFVQNFQAEQFDQPVSPQEGAIEPIPTQLQTRAEAETRLMIFFGALVVIIAIVAIVALARKKQ